MSGPNVISFLPAYIPQDVDMDAVNAAVGADGVSAPAADVPGLKQVVADAQSKGIDLKIVVIANNPPIDTPLRDIATEVGQAHPGSTVLALSPSYAGTYSTQFDRVTLEAGQDVAKSGNPVVSSQNFVGEISASHFPWTAFTLVLLIGVLAAVAATRAVQVRAKRVLGAADGTDGAESTASPAH